MTTAFGRWRPGAAGWAALAARLGPGTTRFVRFGLVGLSGLVVNTLALALLSGALGLNYLVGVVLATQASTTWNFLLSERWVFDVSNARFAAVNRYLQFSALNNTALLVRGPVVVALTSGLGLHYLVSNLVSLILLMVARYVLADRFIWSKQVAVTSPIPTKSPLLVGPEAPIPGGDLRERGTGPDPAVNRPSPGPRVSAAVQTVHEPPVADTATTTRSRARPRGVVVASNVLLVAVPAIILRVVYLNSVGFNSDEAVYAGQAASISGDEEILQYFPVFRAHPLLFMTTVSIVYQGGVSPLAGRLVAVAFGLATIVVVYLLGSLLYGRRAGVIAALLMAVMPYHVVVSRQVLLDGPMVFFATLSLFLLAKFADSGRTAWLFSASATLGLTVLANERSIPLLAAVYAFFALTAIVRVKLRDALLAGAVFLVVVVPYPISVYFAGESSTGGNFLAWQLFRRPNHDLGFYFATVPAVIGLLTIAMAAIGVVVLRRRGGWRELLLVLWILVPLVFYEVWPVKGFQYLLPLAPPIALLAARALAAIPTDRRFVGWWSADGRAIGSAVTACVVVISAVSSWGWVQPASGTDFLAGSGGVPGGREAGEWVAENVPEGAELLAIGPSMANIIQFYGDRRTWGLSVSPNPLHRNPVYEPVENPDLQLRSSELNYLVWDSFSASRSEFFSDKLLGFAERYNGRVVHSEFEEVEDEDGRIVRTPFIVIYEVRP
jgi:putative flippase GtrA